LLRAAEPYPSSVRTGRQGPSLGEEARYYEWIGTLYEDRGAAIELGPWLGKSTKHIIGGTQPYLNVSTARIVNYEGNEHLPRISWNGQPVEIMYIDRGRTAKVNEAWFEVFSESFITDVTLLLLRDWGTHRERPRLSYNETLLFTNAYPELELIHEVSDGHLATFLYRR
jgi:hypothetical protein